MKLDTLIKGWPALQDLGNKPLKPYPTAYRVAKALTMVKAVLDDSEKARVALIRKYGAPSEDGKQVSVTLENQAAYAAEEEALRNSEVSVDLHPIAFADLGDAPIEGAVLRPLLGWFIVKTPEAEAE